MEFESPPTKEVASYQYTPHMILSHRDWDYIEYFQVEFCAYVQASKVNVKTNKNNPRTLDGIYLFPAPNLQGGHQIMYLQMGKYITIPKVFEIPITYVVINNDGEMVG